MADINKFEESQRSKPGSHRINSMRIGDLTNGAETVQVVLTGRRTVNQVDDKAEATRLKNKVNESPWTEVGLGQAFANKSLRTRKMKDPAQELKLFTDSITRK